MASIIKTLYESIKQCPFGVQFCSNFQELFNELNNEFNVKFQKT